MCSIQPFLFFSGACIARNARHILAGPLKVKHMNITGTLVMFIKGEMSAETLCTRVQKTTTFAGIWSPLGCIMFSISGQDEYCHIDIR